MKKIFTLSFILVFVLAGGAEAANVVRAFTCLTGGTTGCLDKIADAAITDGDIGLVVTSNTLYFYQFNDSATDAESSPTYIRPDDYSTSGVWYLVTARVAGLNTGRSSTPEFNFYDGDCTDSDSNARIQVNCTDTGSGTEDCDLTIDTQTAGTLTTRITIDGDGTVTIGGGDLALGSNNLTITGSIAATGSRVTKGWFTDLESTNMPTVGGTAILSSLTAPQFTTIELGHATENTLSASGGVLSVEGVALGKVTGQAWTGAHDFGGATSVEIPNGTDPDVDAAGEISQDTDGANITGDVILRGFDGTNQVPLGRKLHDIHVTVVKPQDMADAVRDAFLVWSNETGMTFTITQIKAWAGTDNTTLNVEETDADGANNATIDALEIATDGTGVYTVTETTITGPTIEAGHLIWLDFDDTDDPAWVKVTITGWYDANVD